MCSEIMNFQYKIRSYMAINPTKTTARSNKILKEMSEHIASQPVQHLVFTEHTINYLKFTV